MFSKLRFCLRNKNRMFAIPSSTKTMKRAHVRGKFPRARGSRPLTCASAVGSASKPSLCFPLFQWCWKVGSCWMRFWFCTALGADQHAANTVTLESLELLKKMRKLYIFNHIYIVASVIIIIVIIVIDRHHFIMFVLTHWLLLSLLFV